MCGAQSFDIRRWSISPWTSFCNSITNNFFVLVAWPLGLDFKRLNEGQHRKLAQHKMIVKESTICCVCIDIDDKQIPANLVHLLQYYSASISGVFNHFFRNNSFEWDYQCVRLACVAWLHSVNKRRIIPTRAEQRSEWVLSTFHSFLPIWRVHYQISFVTWLFFHVWMKRIILSWGTTKVICTCTMHVDSNRRPRGTRRYAN